MRLLGTLVGIMMTVSALTVESQRANPVTNLFVSSTGACTASGTAWDPFVRLEDAISRVRELRTGGDDSRVTIHVMAGEYFVSHAPANCAIERVPIRIDVSGVSIQGTTRFEIDRETMTPAAVLPDGSIFDALEPLVGGEALVLITPDSDGNPPKDVRVDGLDLRGAAFGGQGFFIDRAQGFRLQGNSARGFLNGVRTRAASGELKGNLLNDNHDTGMVLTGGSNLLPAVLAVTGNRSCGNEIGFLFVGTGTFALVSPAAAPIMTKFDPVADSETIPNRVAVSMRNNVACASNLAGVRFFGVGQLANSYSLLNSTHYETVAAIDSRGDRLVQNRYGVSLDAGFSSRIAGNAYSTYLQARFTDDVFTDNTMSNSFLGFTRLQVALGLATPAAWRPLDHSVMTLQADAAFLRGLNFSNPATDSVTGALLDNTLSINGASIANGSCVGGCPDLDP